MTNPNLTYWSTRAAALRGAVTGAVLVAIQLFRGRLELEWDIDSGIYLVGFLTCFAMLFVAGAAILNIFVWRGVDWMAPNFHELPANDAKPIEMKTPRNKTVH